jgi:hypothetical protein
MENFVIAMQYLIPFCLGYVIVGILVYPNKLPMLFHWPLAYGLGMGILGFWMFLLGILGIRYDITTVGIPLILISLILILLSRRFYNRPTNLYPVTVESPQRWDLPSLLLLGFIFFNIVYVFWAAVHIPIISFDGLSTHAFNAKVIYYQRSLALLKSMPHAHYPLLMPLVYCWFTLALPEWNELTFRLVNPFYFLCFLFFEFIFLRTFLQRFPSLVGIALLTSANLFVYHGYIEYRELAMMFYNCTTIMTLLFWSHTQKRAFLTMASFLAACAVFTKLEGLGYLFIYGVLLLLLLRKFNGDKLLKGKMLLQFMLPGICVFLIYRGYVAFHVTRDFSSAAFDFGNLSWDFSAHSLVKIVRVMNEVVEDLLMSGNWNFVWLILFFILLANCCRPQSQTVKMLAGALGMFFGVYILGFALTQHYRVAIVTYTLISRAILHFFPLSTMVIALMHYGQTQQENSRRI